MIVKALRKSDSGLVEVDCTLSYLLKFLFIVDVQFVSYCITKGGHTVSNSKLSWCFCHGIL